MDSISNVVYYPLFIFFKHSERNVQKQQKGNYICAIQEHMLRHEVYLDQQYRGYYYLSQKIEDDLYGDEQALSWNELLDDYQLYRDRKGNLSIKPKG